MHDLPGKTILAYSANPLFNKMDFSQLPVSYLQKEIEKFSSKNDMRAPESDALSFYFFNHAFHLIKSKYGNLQDLPKDIENVCETHIRVTNEIAKRLFFYSIIIAVEEARFMYDQSDRFYENLGYSYGEDFKKYVCNGFKGKLTDFGKLDMNCGRYASGMTSVFAFGNWQHGFGGKGWVPIASLVAECITGRLSLEQFGDQAFSLSHNNGSMFNKGHLYNYYTNFIYDILDIQDSGQIPQWIGENINSKFISEELRSCYKIMFKEFPDAIGGKVDTKLIKNSADKRNKKQAQIKQAQIASWNNQQNAVPVNKPKPDEKINNVLLGGFKIK